MLQVVPFARVEQVGPQDLRGFVRQRHRFGSFAFTDRKFEAPGLLGFGGRADAAARAWAVGVADEGEVYGNERIVDLLGCVAQLPEGEIRVRVGRRWGDVVVRAYVDFFVAVSMDQSRDDCGTRF